MAVKVEIPEFNLRDKLSQLDRRVGSMGGEILASNSTKEVQGLIGVGSRNMLINGGMQIAQRGTSSTPQGGSNTQYPCCDRWGGQFSSPSSTFTVSQSTDAPVGHTHSLKFLTNSAVSPSGVHYYHIGQNIEGLNFAQAGWDGTGSFPVGRTEERQPCTLSFWVKSSNPGKWCVALKGMTSNSNSYLMIYEIEKPNVWEWKSHTIYPDPGQTNWHTGTSAALRIQFDVGTSRTSDLGTGIINRWQNHNTYTYNNQQFQATRIHGIAGATWYLTGVQFERGAVATPFEHRSFGQELGLCMRYYEGIKMGTGTALMRTWTNTAGSPSNVSNHSYDYKVEKRATPTWSLEGNATWYPSGTSGMSAYPSTSTCLFQRNDTTHQFLADGNGDLCGSFRCEL